MNKQLISDYHTKGAVTVPMGDIADHIPFFRQQLSSLYDNKTKLRPWHFWELHNPWSRSAGVLDSWGFLDICESNQLLSIVSNFIGKDIILFFSQFYPDMEKRQMNKDSWKSDAALFPVEPVAGLSIRIPFRSNPDEKRIFEFLPGSHLRESSDQKKESIDLNRKEILCYDCKLKYREIASEDQSDPSAFIVRYFPATSKYIRDESSPVHTRLTEEYPLLNYARFPLWQVFGEDKAANDFVTGFNLKPGRWI